MKALKCLSSMLFILSLCSQSSAEIIDTIKTTASKSIAEWTVLVYIGADNSLENWALYNMNDMSAGLTSTDKVNVLVQWDKPTDNLTWRYKITPSGKINVGNLSSEMGLNPSAELFNSMKWIVQDYPAQHYAIILWNHGSGIEDFYPGAARNIPTWLHVLPSSPERGILYDDSQYTCLTNQGLTNALKQIKQLLGKNLDLIAMDACLMAMVEVTYQMNNLVNIFVGSQQTIPNNGFSYSQFLKPLSLDPTETSPVQLAKNIVSSYHTFYTTQLPTRDFTLSTIDVSSINTVKKNIDTFINAIGACSKSNAATTKSIIIAARKASISFAMPEYIDLYSFYANVLKQTKKISPKLLAKNKAFQKSLNVLDAVIQDGLTKITKIVLQKTAGPVYSGAHGISIYYPRSGKIDSTYQQTLFAKNTTWTKFIQTYR